MSSRAFTFTGRLRSFHYALHGIWLMLRSQHNAWVHACATIGVIIAGVAFHISRGEWCWIVLAIASVWMAEAINTAFEFLCDVASPQFHPMVKQAKDVAAGAVLLKWLPIVQNFNPSDPRCIPFYEALAHFKIPLLSHTGGEKSLPNLDKNVADPALLVPALERGVTVIAAHCGTRSAPGETCFVDMFAEMTRRFPNLYCDTSAFNVPIRGRHVPECLRAPLAERMVHGSDYPVPVHGHFAWIKGYVDWKTFRRWERQPNILERDYQLKRAMGFPAETFTRIGRILRRMKVEG